MKERVKITVEVDIEYGEGGRDAAIEMAQNEIWIDRYSTGYGGISAKIHRPKRTA
jgi:hypothetical protein